MTEGEYKYKIQQLEDRVEYVEQENTWLKEQYGVQQCIIEAYGNLCSDMFPLTGKKLL